MREMRYRKEDGAASRKKHLLPRNEEFKLRIKRINQQSPWVREAIFSHTNHTYDAFAASLLLSSAACSFVLLVCLPSQKIFSCLLAFFFMNEQRTYVAESEL
jgi:hypothetical protein